MDLRTIKKTEYSQYIQTISNLQKHTVIIICETIVDPRVELRQGGFVRVEIKTVHCKIAYAADSTWGKLSRRRLQ